MRVNRFLEDKEQAQTLKKLVLANLILFFGLLIVGIIFFRFGYTKEDSWIVSEAPKRDFCSMVARQLIEKKVSPKLLEEGLFNLVTNDNYKALPFTGIEKISAIWSNETSCKVLIKDELGLRSFDYYLNSNGTYPFYYQVEKITEHDIFEKEDV